MSAKRYLVDTNVLLRFLSGEPAAQAQAARKLFSRAAAGEIVLDVSPVSYKPFFGTNLSHADLALAHGAAALANPLGVSSALETADGYIMLGRRSDRVAYYPARIHPFAGCLEQRDPLDVFSEMRRELSEELSLGDEDFSEMRCIGMIEDRNIHQPEIIFIAKTVKTRSQIEAALDDAEHTATWSAPADADAIAGAVRDPLLTPVGVGTILLWGRRTFGEKWFEQNR